MSLRTLLTTILLLASAGIDALAAEKFPIAGNYGNRDGCIFAAKGDTSSDDLLFLTPDEVGTYAKLCTPLAVWLSGETTIIALVVCGHEGSDEQTVEHVRLTKAQDGRDAYTIFNGDSIEWGEASRC